MRDWNRKQSITLVAVVVVVMVPLTVPLALQKFYNIDPISVLFVIIVFYALASLGLRKSAW